MALYSLLLIDRMVSVTHQWSCQCHALLLRRAANGLRWRRSPIATTLYRRRPVHIPTSEWQASVEFIISEVCIQYKSQKPPATYTRVNDFGPHTGSIFRGRLIRECDLYASIYGTTNMPRRECSAEPDRVWICTRAVGSAHRLTCCQYKFLFLLVI